MLSVNLPEALHLLFDCDNQRFNRKMFSLGSPNFVEGSDRKAFCHCMDGEGRCKAVFA